MSNTGRQLSSIMVSEPYCFFLHALNCTAASLHHPLPSLLPSSLTPPMANKIPPATIVSNIKQCIPLTLVTGENDNYISWSTLFKLHARAYQVYDHIIPPPADSNQKEPTTDESALWKRLDALVLQWIYFTISTDLLNSILNPDDTAAGAWKKLLNIFQDNKATRALHLEEEFAGTHLRDFNTYADYANRLKHLADQLANVGVSEERMVLKLIGGFTNTYVGLRRVI